MFNISNEVKEMVIYTIWMIYGATFAGFGIWFATWYAMNTATSLLQVVMVISAIGCAVCCFYNAVHTRDEE